MLKLTAPLSNPELPKRCVWSPPNPTYPHPLIASNPSELQVIHPFVSVEFNDV